MGKELRLCVKTAGNCNNSYSSTQMVSANHASRNWPQEGGHAYLCISR